MPNYRPTGTSAGYLAFPDFSAATLWYALYGRPEIKDPSFGSSDQQPNQEPNDDEKNPSEENNSEDGEPDTDNESDPEHDHSEDGYTSDRDDQDTDTNNEDDLAPDESGEENLDPDSGEREDDHEDTEDDGESGESGESDEESDETDETEIDGDDFGTDGKPDPESGEETPEPEFGLTEPTELPPTIPGFRIVQADGQEQFIREFASWVDFVTCVRDTPRAWDRSDCASLKQDETHYNKKWAGTDSFDEAIHMALVSGWPEGRAMLSDLKALVAPRPKITEAYDYDVAGAFPSIPAYCAGDPACMVTDITLEHRNQKPIIRIDFGKDVAWNISTKSIMLRGAAMLSFAETLEREGYSTELRIVGSTYMSYQIIKYSIVFKPAGQPLDLDRAAFAIAHPATFRRLIFALYEQHEELYKHFHEGYGLCNYKPVDPTSGEPGGAIFIPAPKSNSETPDQAKRAVEIAAQAASFIDQSLPSAA